MPTDSKESRTVVAATGLTKVFRDFWGRPKAKAVNEIDFEVKDGEIVGLLGPNGSGKSTTVKMILGLLYPTGGLLSVLGHSPRAVETKREIGYLPEESYLYKYLTAYETLDFFGSLFNLSKAERTSRIEQLLDMVGLSHARNRRVGEFSKGMARRIGLAQAMINDPDFLILDEPTSGLDPLGCKEVKDLILKLKERGKTVLVTSHLLSDVEDVCDRVIILYGGKIRAQGPIKDLLTVTESTQITTPSLPAPAMEKVLSILRENLQGESFVVDHPRRTLEEFFLGVIEKARKESVETSGVSGGGKIADYLAGHEQDAKLAALVSEAKQAAPASAGQEVVRTVEENKNSVLEELTREKKTAAAVVETKPNRAEELAEADAKLKDLLGNKK